MKKILVILMFFAFVFVGKAGDESSAILRFDGGNTYDWGEVGYTKETLKCKVKIFNDGNDTLEILSIKPQCGCTKSQSDKDRIASGDYAEIAFDLHIPKAAGIIKKSVLFYSNAKTEPDTLFLTANIKLGYKLQPERFVFHKVALFHESTKEFTLENTSGADFKIDSVSISPNDYFTLSRDFSNVVVKADETVKFTVGCIPNDFGSIIGEITMYSSNMQYSTDNIVIAGFVSATKLQGRD